MSACEGYAAAGPRLGVVRVQVSLMDQEGGVALLLSGSATTVFI